jgi:CDP-glucose 4,6-dehydratase
MPLQPLHPYETAKASQDFAAQTYGKIYKCPVAVTRCGNYFGGYDFNFTRLIPGVVRSIMQGEAPTLRSNGRFTRDFLHIEDAVDVQLLLAQRLSDDPTLYGEAFNFSYGECIEVLDIVHRICQLMNAPLAPVVNENLTPEIPHMQLSSEKARQRLDWKPLLGFSQGLERTVRWYRDYFAYPSDIVGALPQEALLERATMRSETEAGIGRQAGTGR